MHLHQGWVLGAGLDELALLFVPTHVVNPFHIKLLHGLPHHAHAAPFNHRLSGNPLNLHGHPLESLHLLLHLKGDAPGLLSLPLLILPHPYLLLLNHELNGLELHAEGSLSSSATTALTSPPPSPPTDIPSLLSVVALNHLVPVVQLPFVP